MSGSSRKGSATEVEPVTLTGASFSELARELLVRLGEDPAREGLLRTPERMERALRYLTRGYEEDPEKMLNQIVIDMNAQLIEAKKQVASSIADEKRLAKQAEQEAATAAEWERRAMMAVRAGDDKLAKEALARKKEHDQLAQQFQDQWQKQKTSVDQLKLALRALNSVGFTITTIRDVTPVPHNGCRPPKRRRG